MKYKCDNISTCSSTRGEHKWWKVVSFPSSHTLRQLSAVLHTGINQLYRHDLFCTVIMLKTGKRVISDANDPTNELSNFLKIYIITSIFDYICFSKSTSSLPIRIGWADQCLFSESDSSFVNNKNSWLRVLFLPYRDRADLKNPIFPWMIIPTMIRSLTQQYTNYQ